MSIATHCSVWCRSCCVVVATSGWALFGPCKGVSPCAAAAELPPGEEERETIRLDLQMKREKGKELLHVTLTNQGKKAIIVDGQLTIGLCTYFRDNRGDPADLKGVRRNNQPASWDWSPEQWKARMVTLQPGQAATRVIDLYGGFHEIGYSRFGTTEGWSAIDKDAFNKKGTYLRYIWVRFQVTDEFVSALQESSDPKAGVKQLSVLDYPGRGLDIETNKMYGLDDRPSNNPKHDTPQKGSSRSETTLH